MNIQQAQKKKNEGKCCINMHISTRNHDKYLSESRKANNEEMKASQIYNANYGFNHEKYLRIW